MAAPQQFINKWTRVVQVKPPRKVRPGNRVEFLIDGWDTFQRMYEAIRTTLSGDCSSYYIYLLGWWLDNDFLLNTTAWAAPPGSSYVFIGPGEGKKPDPKSSFFDLISRAANQKVGVEVRVMLWNNPFHPRCAFQAYQINQLPFAAAIVDDNTLPLQSYHQKVLLVKGSEGLIGFCGGIDISRDRVQPVPLHPPSPFHDVHCRIQGAAAYDLLDVFSQRWYTCPARRELPLKKQNLRGLPPVSPPDTKAGDQHVGILRTFIWNPRGCMQEASIGPTIFTAIRSARKFIYFEDQYMCNAEARDTDGEYRDVASTLGKRLNDLQHITILIPHSAISDLPNVWGERLEFMETLLKKAGDQTRRSVVDAIRRQKAGEALSRPYPKLRVFFKYRPPQGRKPIDIGSGNVAQAVYVPGKAGIERTYTFPTYSRDDFGPGSYVHSKIWIFDDELAIIGSANCNCRGWNYDGEASAAIFDYPPNIGKGRYSFAQQLRIKLWAKHLDLPQDDPQIINGAGVQGTDSCWFTARARDWVRLYNPWENEDSGSLGEHIAYLAASPAGSRQHFSSCDRR